MSTPSIGLITQEWGQIVYAEEARKLGVSIKCSSQPMSATDLVKFAEDQSFLFVDPRIVKLPTIKSAEKLGITIYPTSKTLEQLEKIETFPISGDYLSIFVSRSAHAQTGLSDWRRLSMLTRPLRAMQICSSLSVPGLYVFSL